MSSLRSGNRYFAEDKDILDLLVSAKQKMTPDRLRELALSRGIITSRGESREDLAGYLSLLPHAWPDIARLLELLESGERAPRHTSESVMVAATVTEIDAAIQAVKDARSTGNESIDATCQDGVFRIKVDYNQIDSNKTRLRQHSTKHVEIQIASGSDTLEVRRHENERASEVTDAILVELEKLKKQSLERRAIDLSGIREPGLRTRFFTTLIKGIEGFTRVADVPSVDVSRFPPADDNETDDGDPSDEEWGDDSEQTDEDEVDEDDDDRKEARGLARRILLRGGGLLQSDEYRDLAAKGFYISEVTWVVVQDEGDPIHATFEAGFADPVNGRGFAYKINGVRTLTTRRTRGAEAGRRLTRTKRKAKRAQVNDWSNLIEQAAHRAFEVVLAEASTKAESDP